VDGIAAADIIGDLNEVMLNNTMGFDEWLKAAPNGSQQGFIVDGIAAADIIGDLNEVMLNNTMGARVVCPVYHDAGCSAAPTDENDCVRVNPMNPTNAPFGAGIATDVFGNWCPAMQNFNVLGALAPGVGIKKFVNVTTTNPTEYAQVINDQSASASKYRSVIESFSYHLLIERNPTATPADCDYGDVDLNDAARINAAYVEISNALKWALNTTDLSGYCQPVGDPAGVPDTDGAGVAVTRLYQNHPNPFNPRTSIKFSLAADGPTKLIIYDVNGRSIRTLVDQSLKAGTHEEVWDGTDDAGHTVTSGVYWSQLQVGSYSSNKKMVVLK